MKTTTFSSCGCPKKPIVREVSQDWSTHVSYAEDGSIVDVVILDAAKNGAWPIDAGAEP